MRRAIVAACLVRLSLNRVPRSPSIRVASTRPGSGTRLPEGRDPGAAAAAAAAAAAVAADVSGNVTDCICGSLCSGGT